MHFILQNYHLTYQDFYLGFCRDTPFFYVEPAVFECKKPVRGAACMIASGRCLRAFFDVKQVHEGLRCLLDTSGKFNLVRTELFEYPGELLLETVPGDAQRPLTVRIPCARLTPYSQYRFRNSASQVLRLEFILDNLSENPVMEFGNFRKP